MATDLDQPRPSAAPDRLLQRQYLPVTLGTSALVTLSAFENRAVGTALPTVVEEFHAVGAYGLANAAPAASFLLALAVAGLWADRRGPAGPFRAGLVLFALAQLTVGTAPSMAVVVAGRLLSGIAEGVLDISLMVLVAQALPASLRPRMFSLFAAMWVLPSIAGPVVTGVITELVGWRWVFLGALVLLVPTALALEPALRRTRPAAGTSEVTTAPAAATSARGLVPWAALAALSALALSVAGESAAGHPVALVATTVIAGSALALAAARLLPPGTTLSAPGMPSVVATRALSNAAFGGAGAFLPLLLTLLHGFSPTRAGVTLSITGVAWAAGSWVQGRGDDVPRATWLLAGMTLMSIGLAGTALLAVPGVSTWAGLTGWLVAGVGMGLTSSSLSVLTLDLSAPEQQGRNSSAVQAGGSISMALAFAAGGALLAMAAPAPGPWAFGAIVAAAAAIAALGVVTARRVVVRDGARGGAPCPA